ncbi:hypothetical protein O9Z70_09715 [Devosia sp. YIM 151766]|uniref:hypothetical protein n=1 Tax=Devosia sp. YIM 151766 TaxID=3017325 RepID=UPI00255D0E11|nr:hypothetical protein [Devosia sp. YIM 151766]WIY51764.1 hypothetical protein O9Z70_09715 [Devosia sp. YIM 151766]
MTIKSTLSIVALLTGVAFSGAAYAQTMVGNHDVSDADMPYVQAHCDSLKLADDDSRRAGTQSDDATEATEPAEGEETMPAEDNLQADIDSRNSSTTVDLDTITLDDCITAGLVERL